MTNTYTFAIKNRFSGAVIFETTLDASLINADVSVQLGAAVRAAVQSGADLRGASLSGADLHGARLYGARLYGADLSHAYLSDAYLSGANLRGADLRGADLRGASLSGADLRGTNLIGANMRGANLYRADLRGANLSCAKVKRMIASALRIGDPYQFFAWEREDGGVWITAGCRAMSLGDYRKHVAKEYPGTDKADETLAILDYFETRAKQMAAVA